MKKIDEILETPKSEVKTKNKFLTLGDFVKKEDCKVCNGSGWEIMEEIEEERGKAILKEIYVPLEATETDIERLNGISDIDLARKMIYRTESGYYVPREVTVQECLCVLKERAVKEFYSRLEKSGLSKMAETKTFQLYETEGTKNDALRTSLKNRCMNFAKNPKGILALLGQTGSGKTHLGTATVINIAYTKGLTAEYLLWKKEMNQAKNDYNKVSEEKMQRWRTVDILYIDDLFWNDLNDLNEIKGNEFSFAWEILDSRINSDKITIISSEFTINDLIKREESFASRIIEAGGKNIMNIEKDLDMNWRIKDYV